MVGSRVLVMKNKNKKSECGWTSYLGGEEEEKEEKFFFF